MMKKTFIPNWYVDKKNQIRNKKIKICITITLIVNIFLLSLILNTSNKIKDINGQILNQKKNINVGESVKDSETIKQDIVIIEKYKELNNFLQQNNLDYKNIVITKTDFEMYIEVKSHEEYIAIIKCIENNYSIKKLTPNIKNEGNFNFEVILEV